jgi:hypothetical protein
MITIILLFFLRFHCKCARLSPVNLLVTGRNVRLLNIVRGSLEIATLQIGAGPSWTFESRRLRSMDKIQ